MKRGEKREKREEKREGKGKGKGKGKGRRGDRRSSRGPRGRGAATARWTNDARLGRAAAAEGEREGERERGEPGQGVARAHGERLG